MQVSGVPASTLLTDQAGFALGDQRKIAFQLSAILFGAGLLGLGHLWGWLVAGQAPVAELMKLAAALLVAAPTLWEGLQGFFARPARNQTEQLVGLAILAALVSGDFTTATLVPLFLELGHLLEERSVQGARAAIEGIRKLQARHATRVTPDGEEDVDPGVLVAGDRVVVRPGEVIPADGLVQKGRSFVDQAPVTGESRYVDVAPGSEVFAGTINLNGLLQVDVTGVGQDTVLGRVADLLQQAGGARTPTIRLLEQYAGYYLPVVVAIAALVLFVSGELSRAIAVLVVACPCALVLAAPAAMVAAMAVATRRRILIKSARFLELVAEIGTLVLDKTGTVTPGLLGVTEVVPQPGVDEQELLACAARCGHGSLHPVSRSAVEAARARGVTWTPPDEVQEHPGKGSQASWQGQRLMLGRAEWFAEAGLAVPQVQAGVGSIAWVANEGRLLGYLLMADAPRSGARAVLDAMRRLGMERIVLLTGDRLEVARGVGEALGVDAVIADVLPEQKLALIEQEQVDGTKVMMVGDGVNDALALSGADIGVAIGARINEVALGGADVALLSNDLSRLVGMVELSLRTRATVDQNILVGVGFSVLMLTLAAFGLISPIAGAILHNGGSVFVIANSARLLRFQEREPVAAGVD